MLTWQFFRLKQLPVHIIVYISSSEVEIEVITMVRIAADVESSEKKRDLSRAFDDEVSKIWEFEIRFQS